MPILKPSRPASHVCAWAATFIVVAALGTASAETVDTVEKSFNAHPGDKLVVDVDNGGIIVSGKDSTVVTVRLVRKIKAGSKAEEERLLREDKIDIRQDRGTVSIVARSPRESRSWFRRLTHSVSRNYQYTITVPTKFVADLKTSGGGIRVANLEGKLSAQTSGGGLDFERILGPIDGRTSGGGIRLAECHGNVKVHTSGGGIDSHNGEGPLDLDTSGGGITVRAHRGNLRARTSGGGITAEQVKGNLDAHTSGGSIHASLLAQPTGDCQLDTSGGGITLGLPDAVAVNLDASTSAGSVRSEFQVPVAGKPKSDHLRGPINGGGPLLRLHSSAGGIRLVKLEAERVSPVE